MEFKLVKIIKEKPLLWLTLLAFYLKISHNNLHLNCIMFRHFKRQSEMELSLQFDTL